MEVFKLQNETEFNVTLEILQDKYVVARKNMFKGSVNYIIQFLYFVSLYFVYLFILPMYAK